MSQPASQWTPSRVIHHLIGPPALHTFHHPSTHSIDERGNLQCAYHGWSFAGQGACVNIPQAEADIKGVAEKSGRACAKVVPLMVAQGMVWLWPDNSAEGMEASRQQPPNTVPELHDPAFIKGAWVTRDLEYGYDTLIENVVDPAHVPFAHHGVQAQRSMAMPLNVTLSYAGPEGVFLCLPRLANSTIGACASASARACLSCWASSTRLLSHFVLTTTTARHEHRIPRADAAAVQVRLLGLL